MKTIIKVQNIQKTYKSGDIDYQALKGISFEVQEGEMVAIMGPSGSGKSTTMHIIGLLDVADSGIFELNGLEVNKYTNDQLADMRNREIGFVFQSFNLLPRANISKNIEVPLIYKGIKKIVRDQLVKEALEKVGLTDKALNMPNQISGGQSQRVAIARALVTKPSIILADEPTGNLDSKTADEIIKIFQNMNKEGKTIIMITHEPDIAKHCKRIINLKDGKIESDQLNKNFSYLL